MKIANLVMKQVWEIGGRKFQDDFERMMMLFDYLSGYGRTFRLEEESKM